MTEQWQSSVGSPFKPSTSSYSCASFNCRQPLVLTMELTNARLDACLHSVQEVLQLEIVRKGLGVYQTHIQNSKLKRQKSFERSVLNLGRLATEVLFLSSTEPPLRS